MLRPIQRIVACTGAALLALLLSGCEVHGTVDVKSGTEAEANLIFTQAEVDCLGLTKYGGLVIKGTPASDGNQTCRAQGTIDLTSLQHFGIQLSQTGELLMVDLAIPELIGHMPIQVDISFPGKVLQGGGLVVSGNNVRLATPERMSGFSRARVVALSHPGPEWWIMSLLGGVVAGITITLTGVLLLRRWRRARTDFHGDVAEASVHPDALVPDAVVPTAIAPQPHPATPAGRARSVRDPDYGALFAPPVNEVPAVPAPALDGPVTGPGNLPSPPNPPATAVADHSIWAPREESERPID